MHGELETYPPNYLDVMNVVAQHLFLFAGRRVNEINREECNSALACATSNEKEEICIQTIVSLNQATYQKAFLLKGLSLDEDETTTFALVEMNDNTWLAFSPLEDAFMNDIGRFIFPRYHNPDLKELLQEIWDKEDQYLFPDPEFVTMSAKSRSGYSGDKQYTGIHQFDQFIVVGGDDSLLSKYYQTINVCLN